MCPFHTNIVTLLYSTLIFVSVHSQTYTPFVNCIGCDVEDSLNFMPANSIVINTGIFNEVEGMILVPYNAHDYLSDKIYCGIKFLGLNSGEVYHDILIDTTGNTFIGYCLNRDDSTSFLVGSTTIRDSSSYHNDTVVTWIGILNHNNFSIVSKENFQYPNSRHTYFNGLMYNSDSSITAIGSIVMPNTNYGKNIKAEISADLGMHSYQIYHNTSNFPMSNTPISPRTIRRLSNGNILYSGFSGCDNPYYMGSYNMGIEEIHSNTYSNWSYDYQSCSNLAQGISILTLNDNSFYAFREVVELYTGADYKSYLEVKHFASDKSIIDTFNIRTTEELNSLACAPVMDVDSNIICLTLVSDSSITGMGWNVPFGRVVKIDRQGNILWYKDINYFKTEFGNRVMREMLNSLSVLPNGDIIVSGRILKGGNTSLINNQDNYIIVERITSDGCLKNECADYYLNLPVTDKQVVSCYPNPTKGILFVELEIPAAHEVYLSDISGRRLNSFTIKDKSFKIDMEQYTNGVYFLTIGNGEHWNTEKIVLNR